MAPASAGIYRPRHPERTILYRVLAQHFERFAPTRGPLPAGAQKAVAWRREDHTTPAQCNGFEMLAPPGKLCSALHGSPRTPLAPKPPFVVASSRRLVKTPRDPSPTSRETGYLMKTAAPRSKQQTAAFTVHPRVLAALGADLITNDLVAVIELVKNSYDALASRVDVRFGEDSAEGRYLEVVDDGVGMRRETVEDVWCVVATPFKKENPEIKEGVKTRQVTGDKGLGRLSAARLGGRLEMVTKHAKGPYLRVSVDWSDLENSPDLSSAWIGIEEVPSDSEIGAHGTRVRIYDVRSEWDDDEIHDLTENLARLISPFRRVEDFAIYLRRVEDDGDPVQVEVESPRFLSKPKYAVRGHVDETGRIRAKYEFRPISGGRPRSLSIEHSWNQVVDDAERRARRNSGSLGSTSECGPFEFEIRAWDLSGDDTLQISERFDTPKAKIRKAIRAHKGISVYRDEVLVLPKSDEARDWLGLDLRRVSRVGARLSTSQVVGYIGLSKGANPLIEDTSDRERLANNNAVRDFREILLSIVELMEVERAVDREDDREEPPLQDLFEEITAEELLGEMMELVESGAEISDALPIVRAFDAELDRVRETIEKRFVFYSRLATVGTIAQMIIHEIRNRTTVMARLLTDIEELVGAADDDVLTSRWHRARDAVDSLESLADRFAPLASRAYRRGKRVSLAAESIERALTFVAKDIARLKVDVSVSPSTTRRLAIDPGELDAIVVNLLTNALYWLAQVDHERTINIAARKIQDGKRLRILVHDNGPGIPEEDAERVFWPGVTKKPNGIGMGLTVASELVAEHGGRMALVYPGRLGGASFAFDLPVAPTS